MSFLILILYYIIIFFFVLAILITGRWLWVVYRKERKCIESEEKNKKDFWFAATFNMIFYILQVVLMILEKIEIPCILITSISVYWIYKKRYPIVFYYMAVCSILLLILSNIS